MLGSSGRLSMIGIVGYFLMPHHRVGVRARAMANASAVMRLIELRVLNEQFFSR